MTQRNQDGTHLDTSSVMMASFQSAERYYVRCWGRNFINYLIQYWTLHVVVPTCQVRCSYWCNNSISIIGVTNSSLMGFEAAPWDGIHT